jgi:ATP-binding cassette subfamily F protein uup
VVQEDKVKIQLLTYGLGGQVLLVKDLKVEMLLSTLVVVGVELVLLELLEQLLQDYAGTVIIVSHDRAFLDNVVTQSIVFEGEGMLTEIVGGYADWRAWQQRQTEAAASRPATAKVSSPAQPAVRAPSKAKLSYKEVRELEALPARIEALEAEQAELAAKLADPVLYQSQAQDAAGLHARSEAIEAELLEALTRWEALEAKATAG